jgi:hypothetical protein
MRKQEYVKNVTSNGMMMDVKAFDRFIDKVALDDGDCWLWLAAKDGKGYARFWYVDRMMPGHRLSYEHFIGSVPDGLELDHLCRIRDCVNPWHLEPVTHQENLKRGINQNIIKTHCPKGHKYTSENTRRARTRPQSRICRECQRYENRKQRGITAGLSHGKRWTYNMGCRCDLCRQANTEKERRRRERVRNA